jgi:hypothetical protein
MNKGSSPGCTAGMSEIAPTKRELRGLIGFLGKRMEHLMVSNLSFGSTFTYKGCLMILLSFTFPAIVFVQF